MNVIAKLREKRRVAILLSSIPESRILGISALPLELWSLVIEHVVLHHLGDARFKCRELPDILKVRLVCQVFDKETQHVLHRHIMLPQLPRMALMRRLLRNSNYGNITTLHMDLSASATRNSAGASTARTRCARVKKTRMADRIQNCITIASHISLPENSSFADPNIRPIDLMQRLYAVALSSTYCQQYLYMSSSCDDWFRSVAAVDANLEAAMLIACGYTAESILHTMSRLLKEGILPPYSLSARPRRQSPYNPWIIEHSDL